METKQISLKEYTEIIGSGGFGLIVKNKKGDKVIKLLYKIKDCLSAEEESFRHKTVYESVNKFIQYTPSSSIYTSRPIAFSNEDIIHNQKHYRCAYSMTHIPTIPGYKNLIHIIFKDEYTNIVNKVIGKIYGEPVSKDNPPRGFFATSTYIKERILPTIPDNIKGELKNMKMIANQMGILYGICIFGAMLSPVDAEYVLSVKNNKLYVVILDFGMFEQMKLDNFISSNHAQKTLEGYVKKLKWDITEIDIYFPYRTSKYWIPFMKGIEEAYNFFVPRIENREIQKSLTYIGVNLLKEE